MNWNISTIARKCNIVVWIKDIVREKTEFSRLVRILVYSFLICSIRLICRVLCKCPSKVGFLEIGKMRPSSHCLGIESDIKHRFNSAVIAVIVCKPACLSIS